MTWTPRFVIGRLGIEPWRAQRLSIPRPAGRGPLRRFLVSV